MRYALVVLMLLAPAAGCGAGESWESEAVILGALLLTDNESAEFVRKNNDYSPAQSLMDRVSDTFSPGKLLNGTLLASQLTKDRERQTTYKLAATATVETGIITALLKEATDRRRPFEKAALEEDPDFPSEFDSFPSGHSSAAFAVFTVLAEQDPENRRLYKGIAITVAVSRVYLEKHYISDVVVGALIGEFVARYTVRHKRGLLNWRF
jgi:hypothetical protein